MTAEDFFSHLWEDYIKIAPAAKRLKDLVVAQGEDPSNDHVAFRTYDINPINLESLEKHVLGIGYERFSPYNFESKKLRAYGYIHPKGFPRVFLSELETKKFSQKLQDNVAKLCAEVDPAKVDDPSVMWAGRLWSPPSYDLYKSLLEESEYAGWVSAIGLRANHFTISINSLKNFDSIYAFADFLKENGFELNDSGGVIKGTPEVLLEQGSTMADKCDVEFANGEVHKIPTCYYEFAMRYPDDKGKLYDGFVAASADKIFESTDTKK